MFTFFTDRDGKINWKPGRVGLRPVVAHLPVHADRRGAPHVCRRHRCQPHHRAHLRGDAGGRHRGPADIEPCARSASIDLPTMQKKAQSAFSLSLDLFGSEVSTNAANYFNAGIKGRFHETKIDDDHQLDRATYAVLQAGRRRDEARRGAGADRAQHATARRLHRRLRQGRRALEQGHRGGRRRFRLELPHVALPSPYRRVRRRQGNARRTIARGRRSGSSSKDQYLPSKDDDNFIASLMAAREGAGQVRLAGSRRRGRHRRQARRFRVCEDRGVADARDQRKVEAGSSKCARASLRQHQQRNAGHDRAPCRALRAALVRWPEGEPRNHLREQHLRSKQSVRTFAALESAKARNQRNCEANGAGQAGKQ